MMTQPTNNNADKRVVVAMSGGVDSSVAAALLVEQGYDVVGMMMRLWSEPGIGDNAPQNRCCTIDQMADAQRVADILDIPFYVVDVQDHFRQTIVQFFIDEHGKGRTPNPCIECNRQIRFTYLLERARALNADYLATGHYARVIETDQGEFELHSGIDNSKDQSYVLHMLGQSHLSMVKFPVGDYAKSDVRAMAERFALPVGQKGDSQDLCFLGDGDYRRFLREHAPTLNQPGPFLLQDGTEIGQHKGLANYTIGQRKGLGISIGEPTFVLRKDIGRNAIIVGPRSALGQTTLTVRDVQWTSDVPPAGSIRASVKIRYKAVPILATITPTEKGAQVEFDANVNGITAGQGAVFYDDTRCLGGGIIADTTSSSETIVIASGMIGGGG